MIAFEQLRPETQMQIDALDPRFDEALDSVDGHLSSIGAQTFISLAENAAEHNGMQYAVVGGGNDQSKDTAILMPGTFANGVWPHLIARAEAISHLAAIAGLRDDEGNIVPVVLTGSPGMKSVFGLSDAERSLVADGNFEPIAEKHLRLADNLGRYSIRGFVGSSQGSVIIAPLSTRLKDNQNFDTEHSQVVLAEPPHARSRRVLPIPRQLVNFVREGMRFNGQIRNENIAVINEIFASGKASPDFEKGIWKERMDNLAIVGGFGKGQLADDLYDLAINNFDTTVVHGSDSLVARRDDIIDSFDHAVSDIKEMTCWPEYPANLHRLEVSSTNHSLMDRVGRFALIAAANLTR